MTVKHYHGRKTSAQGRKLMQGYSIGSGALYAKYLFKHPNLSRPFYWDCKNAVKQILSRDYTTSAPYFSHSDKVAYAIRGAFMYLTMAAMRRAR